MDRKSFAQTRRARKYASLNFLGVRYRPSIVPFLNRIALLKEEAMPAMTPKQIFRVFFLLLAAGLSISSRAADTLVQGSVTDSAGKPIRGAIIKATLGDKTVARFTQADGKYQISLPSGPYSISAEAYGFAAKTQLKDIAQAGTLDFSLSPTWNVFMLSGSELESLVPHDKEGTAIRASCVSCHTFNTIMVRKGYNADQWAEFIPNMNKRTLNPQYSPELLVGLSKSLEKYFGPSSPYFGEDADPPKPEQVKHVEMSDAALNATIIEYKLPTSRAMPHSITIDAKGTAWFSEYDRPSNRLGMFDPATEKIEEFPMPVLESMPHTGAIGKDGRFWVALAGRNIEEKLAVLDPATKKIKTYSWPEKKSIAGHTLRLDPSGSTVWFSGGDNDHLWSFDIETEKFQAHKFPVPVTIPNDSIAADEVAVGGHASPVQAGSYDVAVDSKGKVWATQLSLGTLICLDPVTGETKAFKPENTPSMRGIMVDSDDNVWFGNFHGHKIGRFDQKTQTFKQWQPPTPNATPYGFAQDARTGEIWFADMSGNNITRFEPRSEKFVEYPIPTRNSNSRFIGVDAQSRVWFTEYWNGKIGVLIPGQNVATTSSR
jgi:virginiamycin B lyase